MTNVHISWEDTVDPQACRTNPDIYESVSRDPGRTPFQWDGTKNAGFSTADKTWLPMALNYTDCNVELETSQERSHLKVFRSLVALRRTETFKYGGLQVEAFDDDILAYKREIEDQSDSGIFIVVLNFGESTKNIDLTSRFDGLSDRMLVVISSVHSDLSEGYVCNLIRFFIMIRKKTLNEICFIIIIFSVFAVIRLTRTTLKLHQMSVLCFTGVNNKRIDQSYDII